MHWIRRSLPRRLDSGARGALIAAVTTVAALATVAAPALAAPGDLDATFGSGGKVTTQIGLASNRAQDVVRQPDGKFVLVGQGTGNFDVTRLNADGSLDTAFGDGGTASYSFDGVGSLINGGEVHAHSVALQADGKIVVAGTAESKLTIVDGGYTPFGGLIRLNPNGSLDTSFSGDGKVFLGGTVDDGNIVAVAVAPDGKIVAARAGQVVRYTTAGVLDTTFAGDGSAATGIAVRDVAVQADGKPIAVGTTGGDFAAERYTTAGVLDTMYSGDGRQTVDFPSNATANAVALAPDGKAVLVGVTGSDAAGGDFALARLETDGDLDPTFSGDGAQTVASSGGDTLLDVAVDDSQRVVATGTKGLGVVADDRMAVVRLDAAGSLDSTFGTGGIIEQVFGAGAPNDSGAAVALAGSGVLAFGTTGVPSGNLATDYALARYDSAGALDTTFSGDGLLTLEVGDVFDAARAVTVQPDGKIVVVADTYYGSRTQGKGRFGLLRYNANGTLDTGFGSGGRVVTDFGADVQSAQDVAIQADGKIVVAGYAGPTSARTIALARYDANGTLDTTFSGDGKQTTAIGTLVEAHALALDGAKVVVAGRTLVSGANQFVVARYDSGGTLDPTFSGDGYETTDVATGGDDAHDVAVTPAGQVVAVGSTGNNDASALVRYTTGGALDSGFSGDGKQTSQLAPGTEILRSMALDGDGRIVVAGPANGDFAVARYTAVGELDTTFSGDGVERTDFGAGDDAYGVALQADGRILVGGFALAIGSDDFALARYTTAGALDTSFGSGGKVVSDFDQRGDGAFAMTVGPDDKAVLAGAAADVAANEFDVAVARYLTAGGTPPIDPGPGGPGGGDGSGGGGGGGAGGGGAGGGGGPGGGAGNAPPRDTAAPRLTSTAFKPQAFRTKKVGKQKPGTSFSFKLSEAATLDVQLTLCKNKRCTKTAKAGKLTLKGKRGANSLRFAGKVGGKALKPGSYRARIVARDAAGNRSAAVTVKFTVRR